MITIRNHADLINALPHLIAYTPKDQWVIVPVKEIGTRYPVMGVLPEMLTDMLDSGRVLSGAEVIVITVGTVDKWHEALLHSVIEMVGAVVYDEVTAPNPTPTDTHPLRDEYIKHNQSALDEAYAKAQEMIA